MVKKYFYLLLALAIPYTAYGYKFTFANKAEWPVAVRIQLSFPREPWHEAIIQPDQQHTFDISGRKRSWCIERAQVAFASEDAANNTWNIETWRDLDLSGVNMCGDLTYSIESSTLPTINAVAGDEV